MQGNILCWCTNFSYSATVRFIVSQQLLEEYSVNFASDSLQIKFWQNKVHFSLCELLSF